MTARSAALSWYVLVACLLLVRLPSLAQPAGADQGLYAYVGTRILEGELPYRDAWDQKPPAIHFAYAVLYTLWPHDSIVAAADLLMAATVAILLDRIGFALTGGAAAGRIAAVLFLFLGDPTLGRLAGVRVRSQCETFIAVAITAAVMLAVSHWRTREGTPAEDRRPLRRDATAILVGILVGLAVTLKYNAVVYAPIVLLALIWTDKTARNRARDCVSLVAGALIPVCAMLIVFGIGNALPDWYQATIRYNLQYSGETYDGLWSSIRYLLTFPILQARIDALWTAGGFGCIVLLVEGLRPAADRRLLLPVLLVCAACLAIAINGSRGLPQYFVQAAPLLALAAGVAAAVLWPARLLSPSVRLPVRAVGVLLVSIALWRVTDFGKIPRNASHDLAYITARITRDEHLSRYGGRLEDKYVALSVARLGEYLNVRTTPADRVYIFGFSPGAYVEAQRASASRFFWSRPIIVGFNAEAPGYGAAGLLDDLQAAAPKFIVLQKHDWAPPPADSASYFVHDPLLGPWLRSLYRRVDELAEPEYEVWIRSHQDAEGRTSSALSDGEER